MTLAEFENKYYLHDSSIDKIEYDAADKKLTLTIDFCFWMQNWYDKNHAENGLMKTFHITPMKTTTRVNFSAIILPTFCTPKLKTEC